MNKTKGTPGQRKSLPERRCTSCRQMMDKNNLIRIVRCASDGEFAIDKTGKAAGRGAYICANPDCFAKAKKTGGLDRSFKQKIPGKIYEQLEELMQHDNK